MIKFFVPGLPKPGGSKTAMPIRNRATGEYLTKNGRLIINMVETSDNKDWKASAKQFAQEATKSLGGFSPLTQAVILRITFVMPRPKAHYGSGKNADKLKESAPQHHLQKPDLTKLIRCLEDALTGVLWRDDVQIIGQDCKKEWGTEPGAHVEVIPWVLSGIADGDLGVPTVPPAPSGLFSACESDT